MTTQDTDGLRKAARRIFWEAKQLDKANAAKKEAVIAVLENMMDRMCEEERSVLRDFGTGKHLHTGTTLPDLEPDASPSEISAYFAGLNLGMTVIALNVLYEEIKRWDPSYD